MSFLDVVTIGIREAGEAYHFLGEELRVGGRLENTGIRFEDPEGFFVIRCTYGQGARYALQISFLSRYCNTALLDNVTGSIVYLNEWGYHNMIQLGSYRGLVDEVLRVRGLIFT